VNVHAEIALKALQSYMGDDAQRARAAFRGLTTKQMAEQHGQSGKTRQQILDEYLDHESRVKAAIEWVIRAGVR